MTPLGLDRGINKLWNQGRAHVRTADPLKPIEFGASHSVHDPLKLWRCRTQADDVPTVASVASRFFPGCCAAAVGLAAWYFISNAAENLRARGIASGFGFLTREAGFEIGETTILSYSAADTYLKRARGRVAQYFPGRAMAILFSTLFGALIGLARLSPNWLFSQTRRGLRRSLSQCSVGCAAVFLVRRHHRNPSRAGRRVESVARGVSQQPRHRVSGCRRDAFRIGISAIHRFNFTGGGSLSPEFAALLSGLSLYTASFIAEIVRAGILSVDRGQFEAAIPSG